MIEVAEVEECVSRVQETRSVEGDWEKSGRKERAQGDSKALGKSAGLLINKS